MHLIKAPMQAAAGGGAQRYTVQDIYIKDFIFIKKKII